MEDWKSKITDMFEVQFLNSLIDSDDISRIVSPAFFDDINDETQEVADVTDKHFLSHLISTREAFIAIHNLYNV